MHQLTERGREILGQAKACKDLRLDEFNSYDERTQNALIRQGFYQMLGRANYDLSPVEDLLLEDMEITDAITQGRDLLFSPYQTLRCWRVNEALGIDTSSYTRADTSSIGVAQRDTGETTRLTLTTTTPVEEISNPIARELKSRNQHVKRRNAKTKMNRRHSLRRRARQQSRSLYPLVGAMFKNAWVRLSCFTAR